IWPHSIWPLIPMVSRALPLMEWALVSAKRLECSFATVKMACGETLSGMELGFAGRDDVQLKICDVRQLLS
ncbi:MAG: hypothetical protein QHJ82_09125, partial [Verrucomicrobiota bacterium]|nr:hypothetical protein [Verrucomicrobiota bacterium]